MAQVVKPKTTPADPAPPDVTDEDQPVQADNPKQDPWGSTASDAHVRARLTAIEDAVYGAGTRPPLFASEEDTEKGE